MTDIKKENFHIFHGNALERLKELPDNSVDSIVTDPPYGLSDNKHVATTIEKWVNGERDFIPDGKGFMGKSWDSFVPPPAIWDECLRVLKPGGHLLAFFGSRTQDIGALSIRLAGFEIRDSIAWLYGSGFPKSLDISKQIDKNAKAERKVIGRNPNSREESTNDNTLYDGGTAGKTANITAPSTDDAKKWNGWGTALKPAHEPIVVARKPISEKTVANNVLKWGTGGLNIDASRIGAELSGWNGLTSERSYNTLSGGMNKTGEQTQTTGRFPANIILDETTSAILDEQSGFIKSPQSYVRSVDATPKNGFLTSVLSKEGSQTTNYGDSGGASRFFYVAKASKKDRNEGLSENFHPTVKPTSLMEYLVKLVTPENGTVLDPFTGSGSTGKACLLNGFKFIGVELTDDYLPIIKARLESADAKYKKGQNNE